jgi:hypothetical protein
MPNVRLLSSWRPHLLGFALAPAIGGLRRNQPGLVLLTIDYRLVQRRTGGRPQMFATNPYRPSAFTKGRQ